MKSLKYNLFVFRFLFSSYENTLTAILHCIVPRWNSIDTMKLKKKITLRILNTNTELSGFLVTPSTLIPLLISAITWYATPDVSFFGYMPRLNGLWLTRYPYTNPDPEFVKSKNDVTYNMASEIHTYKMFGVFKKPFWVASSFKFKPIFKPCLPFPLGNRIYFVPHSIEGLIDQKWIARPDPTSRDANVFVLGVLKIWLQIVQ